LLHNRTLENNYKCTVAPNLEWQLLVFCVCDLSMVTIHAVNEKVLAVMVWIMMLVENQTAKYSFSPRQEARVTESSVLNIRTYTAKRPWYARKKIIEQKPKLSKPFRIRLYLERTNI
jgi:hypothetical protein